MNDEFKNNNNNLINIKDLEKITYQIIKEFNNSDLTNFMSKFFVKNSNYLNNIYLAKFDKKITQIYHLLNKNKTLIFKLVNPKNLSFDINNNILLNTILITYRYLKLNNRLLLSKYLYILFMLYDKYNGNIISIYLKVFFKSFSSNISNLLYFMEIIMNTINVNNSLILNTLLDIVNSYLISDSNKKIFIKSSNNKNVFLKLLRFNFRNNEQISSKIYEILTGIYENNLTSDLLYKNIYCDSLYDHIYFSNCLELLIKLFNKESNFFALRNKLKINKGFYIFTNSDNNCNNELITIKSSVMQAYTDENISEYTFILSFNILEYRHQNIEINILTIENIVNKNDKVKIFIDKNRFIKILYSIHNTKNKETPFDVIDTTLQISLNNFYIICLSQKKEKNVDKNNDFLNIYITANDEVNSIKIFSINIPYIDFIKNRNLNIKICYDNFCGILGGIIIINKKLSEIMINKLLYSKNLSYYEILKDNNIKYDLIEKKYDDRLKGINYEIIFDLNDCNLALSKYILINSKQVFFDENGINFLSFQLHNIINKYKKNVIELNTYLYRILQFFFDYFLIMNNNSIETTTIIKNKYNLFLITLMIILYDNKYKDLIKLDEKIFQLLIKYTKIFNNLNLKDYRNILINLLLNDDFFCYKNINKRDLIQIINEILTNNYDLNDNFINTNTIKNIFKLDYILLFNIKTNLRKLFQKIIYSLLHIGVMNIKTDIYNDNNILTDVIVINSNNEIQNLIIDNFISYIFILSGKDNNEKKLYYYLKLIYLHLNEFENIFKENNLLYNIVRSKILSLQVDHCNYCSYLFIICYLLINNLFENKDDIIININNMIEIKDNQTNTHIIKMIDSNFIKLLFAEKFLVIEEKFKIKFIKYNITKENNIIKILYEKIEKSQNIESNQINEGNDNCNNKLIQILNLSEFIFHFNIIIDIIYNLYKNFYNSYNIKILIDDSLTLIQNLIDIIFEIKTENITDREEKLKSDLILSDDIIKFYELFLVLDVNSALKHLNALIKNTIKNNINPFYFKYINNDNFKKLINEKDDCSNITNKVCQIIIREICINEPLKNNILIKNQIILLIIIYNYIDNNMKNTINHGNFVNNDTIKLIILYFQYLFINKFYFCKLLISVDSNSNNYKSIIEMILDTIFKLLNINIYKEGINTILTEQIILEGNKTIFNYIDNNLFQKKEENHSYSFFNNDNNINCQCYSIKNVGDILFSVYFLVYFIDKKDEFTSEQNDVVTDLDILINYIYKDVIEIYETNKKKIKNKSAFNLSKSEQKVYLGLCKFFYKKHNKCNINSIYSTYYKLKNSNKKNESLVKNDSNIKNKLNTIIKDNIKINQEKESIKNNFIQIDPRKSKNNNLINNSKENKNPSTYQNNDTNIPYIYYKYLYKEDDINILRILTNPKNYFIWKIFSLCYKDLIFYNQKFLSIAKSFYVYNKNSLTNYINEIPLKYPTKIKNFTCENYYRPFLKPSLSYFNNNLLPISHSYITEELFSLETHKSDYISTIQFSKLVPINSNMKFIECEYIYNKGSIYGYLYISDNFLLFIDQSENDNRNLDNDIKNKMKYLYSSNEADKLIGLDKYIIIFYKDIKEILIRRFYFNYIGYELFLFNNRTFLFNFINKDNLAIFQKSINQIVPKYNILLINDPLQFFNTKSDYLQKFKENKISNFNYLLLVNKFSTRSYNDIFQYLVFPILILPDNKLRDLSKTLSLNQINSENRSERFIFNYEQFHQHYNRHYSTSGYILYYLFRVNPFTYNYLKFQSYKFDDPNRLFSSYQSFINIVKLIDDNRELTPEFFYDFSFLLNLNFCFFGKLNDITIHDFETNNGNNSFEFIVQHRNLLNKINISYWINNIFGINQINEDILNIFPRFSYEQFNNHEDKIQNYLEKGETLENIYNKLKLDIDTLSMGITPIQLFKIEHPNKENNVNNNNLISQISDKEYINVIQNVVLNKNDDDNEIYGMFLYNKSISDNPPKLFFYKKDKIYIFNFTITTTDFTSMIIINLYIQKNVIYNFYSNNEICELHPNLYCLLFKKCPDILFFFTIPQNTIIKYKWHCPISSIEPYNYYISKTDEISELNVNKIFITDSFGCLILIEIKYEHNLNLNTINIISIKILSKIKISFSSINRLLYIKRLNVLISVSENSCITINNAYSLEFLSIIDLKNENNIIEIKISEYDLLYIYCVNKNNKKKYLKCFTLNGIKVTEMETEQNIINYFIGTEYIYILYSNGTADIINLANFSKIKSKKSYLNEQLDKDENVKIKHCLYDSKMKKIIYLYENNHMNINTINLK